MGAGVAATRRATGPPAAQGAYYWMCHLVWGLRGGLEAHVRDKGRMPYWGGRPASHLLQAFRPPAAGVWPTCLRPAASLPQACRRPPELHEAFGKAASRPSATDTPEEGFRKASRIPEGFRKPSFLPEGSLLPEALIKPASSLPQACGRLIWRLRQVIRDLRQACLTPEAGLPHTCGRCPG